MSADPNKPDDRELEDFLNGEGDIARAWRRGKGVQPPPELDRAVLQIAREAAAAPRVQPARTRWPLALAATLVLSFSLFVAVYKNEQASQQAQLHEAPVVTDMLKEEAPVASSMAPAPAPVEAKAARPMEHRRKAQEPPAAADAPAAPAVIAAPQMQREMERRNDDQKDAAAPQAAHSMGALKAEGGTARMERDEMQQGGAADARALAPPAWLQRIRDARDRGELAAAREDLAAFRKSFPQVSIPEDLKPLLQP